MLSVQSSAERTSADTTHVSFTFPSAKLFLPPKSLSFPAKTADFADLADMVSISTLFAFWIVALALIWNRYYKQGVSPRRDNYKVAAHMAVIVACSVGECLGW